MKTNEDKHNDPDAALIQKIEERAYQIWFESGCGHGDHERHWLQAERELMGAAKHKGKRQSGAREGNKTTIPH